MDLKGRLPQKMKRTPKMKEDKDESRSLAPVLLKTDLCYFTIAMSSSPTMTNRYCDYLGNNFW